MPSHPLNNIELQKYYQNEPRFNRVDSRDSLPNEIKEWYVINFDEYFDIGTHRISLYTL